MYDEYFMKMALDEAGKAFEEDETPIGAVLVSGGRGILAVTHNQTIRACDATAHAEMIALKEGSIKLNNYRLLNTILYVTLEPCIMCMGAIIHARVERVVFGAHDPKWGAAGSLYDFASDMRLNHQPEITSGVCAEESRLLLQKFFRDKRKPVASGSRIP
jgi:tRNA(adenine34) deaminase